MFSYEICEIFKNTYFEEHLQTTGSEDDIHYNHKDENRSSRSQMIFKIGVLVNFTILTGKHLSWSLIL